MASQYRQTILGPLWHLLQPLLTSLLLIVLFTRIAHIPTDGIPAILFYLGSVSAWNFFMGCFNSASATFVSNAAIFGKVYFPRLIVPVAITISNTIRFGIQFLLFAAVYIWELVTGQYTFNPGSHLLLLPLIVIVMALMGLAGGIIVSALTARYRDIAILISFGLQLFMYITPVAYSLQYLQSLNYGQFIMYNPLSPLVEGFRYAVFGTGYFTITYFMYSVAWCIALLAAGLYMFNKVERNFMDTV